MGITAIAVRFGSANGKIVPRSTVGAVVVDGDMVGYVDAREDIAINAALQRPFGKPPLLVELLFVV